jgi:hypothetical protein
MRLALCLAFMVVPAAQTGQAQLWFRVEIIGDVAADAEALALGVLLTLEVLGDAPKSRAEGPKALKERELRGKPLGEKP